MSEVHGFYAQDGRTAASRNTDKEMYFMDPFEIAMVSRPPYLPNKAAVAYLPISSIEKATEQAVTIQFVADRRLFGACYSLLRPEYFDTAQQGCGVMIAVEVESQEIVSDMKFPGDIDILIIPYEGNQLIVSDTLAVEVKVVRARFERQEKSPNQFVFSQAKSLLKYGFPFVAVVHLIVSDKSPLQLGVRYLYTL